MWLQFELEEVDSWRNTRVVIKHASGKNTRGENTRLGRKHARGEKRNPLSSYFSRACHQSRAACSVLSAFSERHAHSRCTEDSRCFKFQITAQCKFNMKHHIKHTDDYRRRQSCTPSVETLDFTISICSTPTFLYFDLYLN